MDSRNIQKFRKQFFLYAFYNRRGEKLLTECFFITNSGPWFNKTELSFICYDIHNQIL